jgi:protein involved in polysaccharide export with SLBB domain
VGTKRIRLILPLLLSLPLGGALAQQGGGGSSDSSRELQSEPRGLQPGDAIRLSGGREAEVPGDYPVDETGRVVLPFLGARIVSGIPALELKNSLAADYHDRLRNQEVQISLLRRVRVLGAVKNPGIYLADPTMKVADVIALAGGATMDGKLRKVQIVRGGKVIEGKLDAESVLEGELQSGDQVMVPERSWFARNGQYVLGGAITALGIVIAQVVTQ